MSEPTRPAVSITPDLLISQLLRAYPEARPVLARHGLCTCGGAFGPSETIRFFARVHGVEPSRLVHELKWAVDHPVPLGDRPFEDPGPRPYRWYFPSGVLLAFTAFAAWSSWLFWSLSKASPGRVSPVEVHLHAHAQLSGWILLFVMGLTAQFLPRLWRTKLAAPRLTGMVFLLMFVGLGFGLVGELLTAFLGIPGWPVRLGLVLQGAAFLVFVSQLVWTFRVSRQEMEPFTAFVLAGLFWLALIQWLELGLSWGLVRSTEETASLFGPRMHIALHMLQLQGTAVLVVLGLCLRLLPALYGLRPIKARRAWWGLDFIATGLIGELLLLVAFSRTGHRPFGTGLPFTWVMLATGVGLIASEWVRGQDPAERGLHTWMIRAALAWLTVAFMLLVPPSWTLLQKGEFGLHDLRSSNHALGLGFILSIIMGLTARLIPLLEGRSLERDRFLDVAFGLISLAGGLVIVSAIVPPLEVLRPGILAASATLAASALGLWAARMVSVMSRREERRAVEVSCGCEVEPVRRSVPRPTESSRPLTALHDTQGSSILMLPG